MIVVRCKDCNKELSSHPGKTKSCGCSNMMTLIGDSLTARDLSRVVMIDSGVKWDVRKSEPYSSYDEMDFIIPVGQNGDVYDRYIVRLEEMRQSNEIVRQAMDTIPKGKFIVL